MKMVKSLLLGSAAGLVAVAGAQAADLPVKAKPAQYVKICSLYGAGYYYIPGTDTCIKIGGFIRAEVNFNAGGSFGSNFANADARTYSSNAWRTRAGVTFDTRSQTAYGTLRSYIVLYGTGDNSRGGGYVAPGVAPAASVNTGPISAANSMGADSYVRLQMPAAFIQIAGFTAGKTASFFDFDAFNYSNYSNLWGSQQGGNGVELFAYTAQLGNGLSASLSIENPNAKRNAVTNASAVTLAGITTYGAQVIPDIVGNLRVDQAWGSAQIMAAYHQITYSAGPGDSNGWAVGAGLKFNLPMLGAGDYIQGQLTWARGAMEYVGSGFVGANNFRTQGGVTSYALLYDAVVTGATTSDLTTGWSIVGGFEHFWMPTLKSSLYGSYGNVKYSDAASNVLAGVAVAPAFPGASFSLWQIGSRTVYTVVPNLDLSAEINYTRHKTGYAGLVPAGGIAGASIGDNGWWAGIVRVQRNFWP